jgi:hypothetical protein
MTTKSVSIKDADGKSGGRVSKVETIHSQVVFVPTSNLAYLIASAE